MSVTKSYTYTSSLAETEFSFVSSGKTGNITKLVHFTKIGNLNGCSMYNLALGDQREDGTLDDTNRTNNHDIFNVMSTVSKIAFSFLDKNPLTWVTVAGNEVMKTKLYERLLRRNFSGYSSNYEMFGAKENNTDLIPFSASSDYDWFILRKRK